MPIAAIVGAVLYDNRIPADMGAGLMGRPARAERQGIDYPPVPQPPTSLQASSATCGTSSRGGPKHSPEVCPRR